MINFFNSLIPKNFIVANIVDTLKDDPENGPDKVFEMADKYLSDPAVLELIGQVKDLYYTRPGIRRYTKNLIYNTQKTCLNHLLQNVAVKHFLEGHGKREEAGRKYRIKIPQTFILNIGTPENSLPASEADRILTEAKELGIHLVTLRGERLFERENLLKLYKKHHDIHFLAMCEGPLDHKHCHEIFEAGNVLPLLIYDGEGISPNFEELKNQGLLYGVVTPLRPGNARTVTDDPFILPLIRQGSRINWYVAATGQFKGSEERDQLRKRIGQIRNLRPYLTLYLESEGTQPLEGSIIAEETVNGATFQFKFPEIHSANGCQVSLKDFFSMQE